MGDFRKDSCHNNKCDKCICDLLSTLEPGQRIIQLATDELTFSNFVFLCFEPQKCCATFKVDVGQFVDIVKADCRKIIYIEL